MSIDAKEKQKIFNEEFYPLADALYNFAYRLTLNESDSNDLVQDTYLKAFRFVQSYQVGSNARAWLYRIMKNSFINDYRKKSRQPTKVDYADLEQTYNSERANYTTTVDLRTEMFKNLLGDEISGALNSLPVDFRVIVMLADIEDFTYEEIAKIVDIPIGTVRSRLHRARNTLKEKLATYASEMGYGK